MPSATEDQAALAVDTDRPVATTWPINPIFKDMPIGDTPAGTRPMPTPKHMDNTPTIWTPRPSLDIPAGCSLKEPADILKEKRKADSLRGPPPKAVRLTNTTTQDNRALQMDFAEPENKPKLRSVIPTLAIKKSLTKRPITASLEMAST